MYNETQLRERMQTLVSSGFTDSEIATQLNKEGLRTKTGRIWKSSNVFNVRYDEFRIKRTFIGNKRNVQLSTAKSVSTETNETFNLISNIIVSGLSTETKMSVIRTIVTPNSL